MSTSNTAAGQVVKKRRKWNPEDMKKAVEAVHNKKMGFLKAHKVFGVPKSTLEDYVKNKDGKSVDDLLKVKIGRKPIFPDELESLLVQYLLDMEKRFFGLRARDVRQMAFQLALQNNLRHPFRNTGQAGKKWLRLFMRRHRELSFRTPQAISAARVRGFTKHNVEEFFDIYEKQLEKVGSSPQKIFNVDETGVSIVQHKTCKVIGLKGKKQIASISSAERGSLVTLVTCMSAAGQFIPPMFVFPRKNMKPELMNGAPPGSISSCHVSGWIQGDSFTKWLHHFIAITKPSVENPVILVLDGHYSHTRNIDVINVGRKDGVIIVCLPPHSTHKMQALDVAFMSPFKTYYAQEIETCLRNNSGRVVTAYQIAELVCRAYARAATIQTAINGFKKTGLFPCNRNVFDEHEFAIENDPNVEVYEKERTADSDLEPVLSENVPPSSQYLINPNQKQSTLSPKANTSVSQFIKPTDVSPLPSFNNRNNIVSENAGEKQIEGKKGKAVLITGSPYKVALEESLENIAKKKKPVLKTLSQNSKKSKSIIIEEPQPSTSGAKKVIRKRTKLAKKQKTHDSSSSSSAEELILTDESDEYTADADDAECMVCLGLFSKDTHGEAWARCSKCFKWGHEKCTGFKKKAKFICAECLE